MTDYYVRAVLDYSNTAGNSYQQSLPNGGMAIQQADGVLFTRRPDGSLRGTPLYTRDELDAAVANAVAAAFGVGIGALFTAWVASLPVYSGSGPAPVPSGRPYLLGPGGPVVIAQ